MRARPSLGLLAGLLALAVQAEPASAPQAKPPHAAAPAWLKAGVDATGKPLPPYQSVAVLRHLGRPAYLLVAPCCDQLNPLYDEHGRFLCHPSGGITGRGDGTCPAAGPAVPSETR